MKQKIEERSENIYASSSQRTLNGSFCLTGLMADSLGSYTHAFYMAGSVVIAGACIPFLLLCMKKREPVRDRWATLGPNEELAEAPNWRRSIVYMIEEKAT